MFEKAQPYLHKGVFSVDAMDSSIPVLILGGRENSLSLARSFGRLGITVKISGPRDCWGMNSRYCSEKFHIPKHIPHSQYWADLLLEGRNLHLHGSLLIAGSDTALEFLAANHAELSNSFIMGHHKPQLQFALLDKRKTLDLARKTNVAAPEYWNVETEEDLQQLVTQVRFPVMVKPIHSHKFIPVMGCKLFIVQDDVDELVSKIRLCWENNLEIMAVEMIPGPDSELSSFYTYIDDRNKSHFKYTKKVIRRYPANRGLACYHATEWLPETAAAGEAFFSGIGFTGFGNIEFKRDYRDNQLKVIEANTRFTAAQELIVRSGAPIDLIYYCVATGQISPTFSSYQQDLTYWYGLRDTLAFLELRRAGKLTMRQWLASLSPFKQVSPLHDANDLYPTISAITARIVKTFG
ncbi:MAG: carboxylate--amine ligase [Pseudomonadota bacterium]